jgi:hypothetical protein
MNTTLIALAAGLGIAGSVAAMPPAPLPSPAAPAAETPARPLPPALESGKVLVLDNEQLIEGDVTKLDDWYRVRRGGGETLIPSSRVLKLVEDRPQAYEVLRHRIDQRDADERLRLARWCAVHGLREQGLAEAEAAAKLRPNDPEALALLRGLAQLKDLPAPKQDVIETNPSQSAVAEELAAPPDFNSAAYGQFVSKVQPLLMNACASCHAGGESSKFKLVRVFDIAGDRQGSLQNLAATLAQVNRDNQLLSPLLTKSLTAHGDAARAPLKGAEAPAYRLLEAWVQFALAPEGTPKPELNRRRPEPGAEEAELPQGLPVSQEMPKPLPKPPRLPGPRKTEAGEQKGKIIGYQNGITVSKEKSEAKASPTHPDAEPGESQGKPARPGPTPRTPPAPFAEGNQRRPRPQTQEPADPFDPAIFNSMGTKKD